MTIILAVLATITLAGGAVAAESAPTPDCDVPERLISTETELTRVNKEITDRHRLDITVVGSRSSALSGPDGARFAYPAQLEIALKERLPGNEIKVTAHVPSGQTTADMAAGLAKILSEDHPALVIWQAGTVDALRGVEPDDFRQQPRPRARCHRGRSGRCDYDEYAIQPTHRFHAWRCAFCRRHALGCRAA